MRYTLLICLLIGWYASNAQTFKDKANFKILFNLDFKQTRVSDRSVAFYGYRLGAQKEKNIVAVGYYGLFQRQEYLNEELLINNEFDTVDISLDINYAMLIYERILLQSEKWQLSVPLALGLGNVRQRIREPGIGDYQIFSEKEAFVSQVAVRASYSIKFWLFAQAAAGQRYVFTRDKFTDQAYSGFTWTIGVGIKTGALIKHWKAQRKNV